MRRLVLVLTCGLLAAAAAAQTVWQDDFEQGKGSAPTGWSFAAVRGAVAGAWEAAEPAGGHSLRLQVKEPGGRASWIYGPRLPLKPDTNYRLRLKVMRAQVAQGGRAYVILYENGVETPETWQVTPSFSGTQDWQPYELVFRTHADATWGRLQVKLWGAPGYAWFDDLVLEELPAGPLPEKLVTQRPAPADDGSPLQLMWYPAQRRPDTTLHLLPGAVNPVSMFFWGRKAEVTAPYLIVETPPQVRLHGPVTCSRETIPEAVELKGEPVVREGQAALRWRVPIRPEPLLARLKPRRPDWTAYHFIYVQPEAGCPEQFTWRWQTECAGKTGPPHEIPARLAPREAGALPHLPGFPLYAQHSDALRLPDAAGRRAVLDYLAYAGIEGGLSLGSYQREYHPIDQELGRQGYFTWEWLWDGYNQPGGEQCPLVYDQEKPGQRKLVCPQAQVDKVEPWWGNLRAAYRSRLHPDTRMLIINFEPPYFDCCFCPRCRAAFAAFGKLPAEQVNGLTPQHIQALPDDAWGHFRAWQNGQIVKHHCEAIHEVGPEVTVGLCGPPYDSYTPRRGMDIRLFEPEVGFHAPMLYEVGTTYADLIRSTCEGTKAPVIPFVLASDHAVPNVFPSAQELRTNLLVTAASGGRGAVLWVGIESLDGEYLGALRRALREIALLAPYLEGATRSAGVRLQTVARHPRTVTVDGVSLEVSEVNTGGGSLRQWSWTSPRGRLLVLVNYEAQEARQVEVPAARALFGPAPVQRDGKWSVELQAGETVALVAEP